MLGSQACGSSARAPSLCFPSSACVVLQGRFTRCGGRKRGPVFLSMIHAQNEQCALAVEQRPRNEQALAGSARKPCCRDYPTIYRAVHLQTSRQCSRELVSNEQCTCRTALTLPPVDSAWGAGLPQLQSLKTTCPRRRRFRKTAEKSRTRPSRSIRTQSPRRPAGRLPAR